MALRNYALLFAVLLVATFAVMSQAQTYDINNQNAPSPTTKAASQKHQANQSQNNIGWGSSIEVARIAHAAQDAMRRGDANQAMQYAKRAATAAPQNSDFWFLYGYAARLAGHYQESVDAYDHGLKLKPSSLEGLSGLAQTYVRMGKTEEAKKILDEVLAANPRNAQDLLLAGEILLNSGDAQRALILLQRGDALQPSARSELLMAKAYQRLDQTAQAQRLLETARHRAPNDLDVLRAIAGFYRESGNYQQAVAVLQQVHSRSPNFLGELAYTYKLAGSRKEAAETYSRAADEAPHDMGLQLNAAEVLINNGEQSKAQPYLDRVAAAQPDYYRLHALRGDAARMDNRIPDAIREYQLALKNVGENAPDVIYPIELHMSLAELYRESEDEASAQREVDAASTAIRGVNIEGPRRPEFLRLRAAIEMGGNDLQSADRDLKEAVALDPNNDSIALQYANLLWKLQQKQQAKTVYQQVLARSPNNRYGLTSMGYLARDMGDLKSAESFFRRASNYYPDDYVPYLAMGDLYTSTGDFTKALANYQTAYKISPNNPLIVAGGANASLESHNLMLAKTWLDRAHGSMNNNPQVMRETERYLTWTGKYEESAQLGFQVIQKLPTDREAPVYLAYDLLYLNRYDDALALAERYQPILPKEKDLWLVTGYVHTHSGDLDQAVQDFSHALELDPRMATGYVNRGFVLNDIQNAKQAAQDFQNAIQLRPNYGEAHLGLAFADLQLHRPKPALEQADAAGRLLGESKAIHLARAGAYEQELLLSKAVEEYRDAIKLDPTDLSTHLALAGGLYRMHRYNDAIAALQEASKIAPDEPTIYSELAHNYARLHRRDETMRYIRMAEQTGGDETSVLLATGDALLTLGDESGAMDRFAQALGAPDADRVDARLAIAQVFLRQGHFADARQQVSLAFAEARIGESSPITTDDLVEAAEIFLQMHDFALAQRFFARAKTAGADESVISIGMANAYLARGETQNAQAQLASLGDPADYQHNYDYMMAQANVYRQLQDNTHALEAFARADTLGTSDDAAERAEMDLALQEGKPLTDSISMLSHASFSPIFEDINIYQMDARLLNVRDPKLLPPPRSSFESKADAIFKAHVNGFPTITGFVEERNANGSLSFPSQILIQNRNTYDTSFNGGLSPVLHWGANTIVLNPGLQATIRRDTSSPTQLNQNLFRQFLYLSTSSFFNWISLQGSFIHETGPFTEESLSSRDLGGELQFTVGRTWGKTALLTSYAARDLQFHPGFHEYYQANTSVGLQRKLGEKLTAGVFGEYLRGWRVEGEQFALAQAMRPGARFEYRPNTRWSVHGAFALSRGEGFHDYDNADSELLVSYIRPLHRSGDLNGVSITYPLSVSFGIRQQDFYNFSGHGTTILPVIQLSLF